MKLGVISDTHGNVRQTTVALDAFVQQGVSRIIHCGDIGTPSVVQLFQAIPTDFVFGNSDPCTETLRRTIQEQGQTCFNWFGERELDGRHIAFLHGHDSQKFEDELNSEYWDLLCFGHTHVAELRLVGKMLLLNPGAIHRSPTPSIAVVDLETMGVSTIQLKKASLYA